MEVPEELPEGPGVSPMAAFVPPATPVAQAAQGQASALPVSTSPPAATTQFILQPGQAAPPLTAADKLRFPAAAAIKPLELVGALASAGIDHLTNRRPHFGTDSGAFGERLGTTVYREDVKAFFGVGLLPILFHDDPRYYTLGSAYPFRQRALFAAKQIVVARKDNGEHGINYPRLLSPVISQGSVNGFYPDGDRDVRKTIIGILVSYASSAGGNELKEFRQDILRRLHPHP